MHFVTFYTLCFNNNYTLCLNNCFSRIPTASKTKKSAHTCASLYRLSSLFCIIPEENRIYILFDLRNNFSLPVNYR